MKSGLASALTAFAEVAKSQKENAEDIEKLPGTLVFIGTVDEEADMKGSEAAVQQGWIQKEDWVLDMEPTSGMIQMAHKGRTWKVLLHMRVCRRRGQMQSPESHL